MPKGLKSSLEDRKKKEVEFQSSRELRLGGTTGPAVDAKIARIRFLTDIEEYEWAYFHGIPALTRTGKRFNNLIYCLMQDGQECPYDRHSDPEVSKVRKKLFFWVYVYNLYHTNPDSEGKWQKSEYEGEDYYVEPVNAVRLLKTGPGQGNLTEAKFEKWSKKAKGTICDRDFNWSRTGTTWNDTSYDLVPCDEGKCEMPGAVREAAKNLVPLSEVIKSFYPKTQAEDANIAEDEGDGSAPPWKDDAPADKPLTTAGVPGGNGAGKPAARTTKPLF